MMHGQRNIKILKESGDFEDRGLGGYIILKLILNKVGGYGLDASDS
jgi:hypothetical protein